ncbi:ATP-dependent RNA helicase DBP3 isoform X2 [Malania oleifera]|uniref:ATP-dependent RNA helicase DBP3 isoform X2 n=1 Tax=Malania oleifera TaxID=397392 RepID=UPI0025AE7A5B|nr:ATP-dependent RNA helicase DBP3 isoform X2 [Malania oleifera]
MAKGDDSIRRKKNKEHRKKLGKESSAVSSRVAAIIAAKKRRKSGKRRICEGMCFSLPTLDDPFNDRHGKKDLRRQEAKKCVPLQAAGKISMNGKTASLKKGNLGRNSINVCHEEQKKGEDKALDKEKSNLSKLGQTKIQLIGETSVHAKQLQTSENSGCPSKFLLMCLISIQNALQQNGTYNGAEDKPLFANAWGVEFWKGYSVGKDILETSGSSLTIEQVAWIASTAADTIARKEKEGLSFTSPFLLFLVPSQEKATKVRSVCKPLKAHGIHTVSLHPGASLDHQIHGLKSCEPEFLVSTPERLLELIALNAVDISGVSALVVEALETPVKGCYIEMIKSVRQFIPGSPHTVVFSDCLSCASVNLVQSLLTRLICRLFLNGSITSQSACIHQCVHVFASQEEKLSQGIQVLDEACGSQLSQFCKMLVIIGKDSKIHKLVAALKSKGYSISSNSVSDNSAAEESKRSPAVSLINVEHINATDLEEYEVVIIPDFALSIHIYVQVLTRMARHSVNGVLLSFLTPEDALLAGPLIDTLEQCGQAVPESLRNMCHSTSSMLERNFTSTRSLSVGRT